MRFSKIANSRLFAGGVCVGLRVLGAGVSLLATVVVARSMSPQNAGVLFLSQTVLLLASVATRIGIDNVIVREAAKSDSRQERKSLVSNSLAVVMGVSLLGACAIAGFAFLAAPARLSDQTARLLTAVSVSLVCVNVCSVLGFESQGRKGFVRASLFTVLCIPGTLLASVSFLGAAEADPAYFVVRWQTFLLLGVTVVGLAIWIPQIGGLQKPDFGVCHRMLAESFSMYCVTLVSYVNTWLPQLALATVSPASAVALLCVSQRTAGLVALLITPFNTLASPSFARLNQTGNPKELIAEFRRLNGVVALLCVPFLFGLFFFSGSVLQLFGDFATEAGLVLKVMLVGQLSNVVTGTGNHLLMMTGRERQLRSATFWSACTGVGMAVFLIPMFGLNGAAICVSGNLVVYNYFVCRLIQAEFPGSLIRQKPAVSFPSASTPRGSGEVQVGP